MIAYCERLVAEYRSHRDEIVKHQKLISKPRAAIPWWAAGGLQLAIAVGTIITWYRALTMRIPDGVRTVLGTRASLAGLSQLLGSTPIGYAIVLGIAGVVLGVRAHDAHLVHVTGSLAASSIAALVLRARVPMGAGFVIVAWVIALSPAIVVATG